MSAYTRRQKKRARRREKRNRGKPIKPQPLVVQKGSRSGSKEVKLQLELKYGYVCYICGCRHGKLQLHHIKPIRLGGKTNVENGVLLCENCHKAYHGLYDLELDEMYVANPDTDYNALFEKQIKSLK